MQKMYNRMFVEIIHECNTRKEEYVLLPESKLILREHHCSDTNINFYVPNSTEGQCSRMATRQGMDASGFEPK